MIRRGRRAASTVRCRPHEASVDDSGKGYTSLGYLSALTIHELKIDKSFVADLPTYPAHAAIIRSIVDFGHILGLSVVGEGVDTDGILTTLRQTGCDVAQGYLLAHPMPADQLAHWLHTARPIPPLAATASRPPLPA